MKLILFTFSILTFQFLSAQNLIDSYGTGSGYCSSQLRFYSDSTFVFESGCEGDVNITFGSYKTVSGQIFLKPETKESIDLKIEISARNSEVATDSLNIIFLGKYDSVFHSDVLILCDTRLLSFASLDFKRDAITRVNMEWSNLAYHGNKNGFIGIDVFFRLFNRIELLEITPFVREIIVKTDLPAHAMLSYAGYYPTIKYNNWSAGEFNFCDKLYIIE